MNTHGEQIGTILAANEGLRKVLVECGFDEDMADNQATNKHWAKTLTEDKIQKIVAQVKLDNP